MRHLETRLLGLLVLADTLSTYWLVSRGYAVEFNPLMAWLISIGWGAFFGVKLAALAGAVAVAEWYRKRNPLFVRRVLQVGAVAYLALWVGGALISSLAH